MLVNRYSIFTQVEFCDLIENKVGYRSLRTQVIFLHQSLLKAANVCARLIVTGSAFHNRTVWTVKEWSRNLVVSLGIFNFKSISYISDKLLLLSRSFTVVTFSLRLMYSLLTFSILGTINALVFK